jgi:HD-GYP domain-containing protein (c-di-GMP phosphodiesterase class II)
MFVAHLDRPWLETPFLLQGFMIRDEHEVSQLRKYCKYVFVDLGKSSLPTERILKAQRQETRYAGSLNSRVNGRVHTPPQSVSSQLISIVTRLDPTGKLADRLYTRSYRNHVSTRKEAPRAMAAYDLAVAAMDKVMAEIREGRPVDVDSLKGAVKPLIDSVLRNQDAMAWLALLRKRDEATYRHPLATAIWAVVLGRHLGFDRQGLDTLALGGLLLDFGKAKIPESIVAKPAPLDLVEIKIVQKHVALSLEMVRKLAGINADVIAMVECHHERHDGSGYPKGLAGSAIPIFGRIAGILDSFDAMTTKRAYAPARSAYDAMRELNSMSGTKFQRELVEHFVQALGMFPTGSLVEMSSGQVCVVVEQNRSWRLRPKVLLLLDADKKPAAHNSLINLSKLPSQPGTRGAVWITRGLEPGAFGIDPKDYFLSRVR